MGNAEDPSSATLEAPPQLISPARRNLGLLSLATASFVYVTAETLPIGLLPQLARALSVRDGSIGLLVTIYAAAAGLAALPVTAWLDHRSRRGVVAGCVTVLAVSQFTMAVAPNYAVVLAARILCAMAHGAFWAMLAPVATRLVRPERAGRATAVVFAGSSLALVFGTPVTTAMGEAFGWRVAAAAVGMAGLASAATIRAILPPLRPGSVTRSFRHRILSVPTALRSASLIWVCVIAALVTMGHFAAYTYVASLVRHDAGIVGFALSALLFGYGAAGIAGVALSGLVADQRPRLAGAGSCIGVAVALAGLAAIGRGPVTVVVLVLIWGMAFTAVPVALQSAVLRVAPRSADTASALLVMAFQVGIGGGSLLGAFLVDAGHLTLLPFLGATLAATGSLAVFSSGAFSPGNDGS